MSFVCANILSFMFSALVFLQSSTLYSKIPFSLRLLAPGRFLVNEQAKVLIHTNAVARYHIYSQTAWRPKPKLTLRASTNSCQQKSSGFENQPFLRFLVPTLG